MAEYASRRDERVKPLYDFTCELAAMAPPPLLAFINPENAERAAAGEALVLWRAARLCLPPDLLVLCD